MSASVATMTHGVYYIICIYTTTDTMRTYISASVATMTHGTVYNIILYIYNVTDTMRI